MSVCQIVPFLWLKIQIRSFVLLLAPRANSTTLLVFSLAAYCSAIVLDALFQTMETKNTADHSAEIVLILFAK